MESGIEVEWLILADGAEVVNNKLYLLGGGWDVLTVNTGFPVRRRLAIALSARIPWNETNQQHEIDIEIRDEEGNELLRLAGEVEVGRPPGLPHGHDQRVQMAIDGEIEADAPGSFAIIARALGIEKKRAGFSIVGDPGRRAPRDGAR